MVNDDDEFIYKYMECLQFDLTQNICWIKLHVFALFVDYEDDDSCSKEYSNRENQFEVFGYIAGRNSTSVWNGK